MTTLHSVSVLLILVFAIRVSAEKPGTFLCEPQNVQLSNVSQELLVRWEVLSSCTSLRDQLIFELMVLVENTQVHHEEFAVMAGHVETSHRWSWVSFLPLECASHSVRIRSSYKSQSSLWITETLPGQEPSEEIQVYPQDHVFEVNSRATFCCIIPLGHNFSKMSLSNYREAPSNTSKINNHTYALTVDLLWPTLDSDADVKCKTQLDEAGSCAVIGYPPSDSNLTCETRDFQSVQCFWTTGAQIATKPTKYWLLEQSCSGQSMGECSQKVKVDHGKRNWTLSAQNVLGAIELVNEADLTKRVYMYAPEDLTLSAVGARNVSIRWTWTVKQYKLLNLTCKIKLSDKVTTIQMEKSNTGLHSVVLNGLIPNWNYNVMVQCATETDFWKWGEWSKTLTFETKGDVPDVLDIWMHNVNNQTVILWKLLEDHQRHGHIIDYEVTWVDIEKTENKVSVVHPNHSVTLNLSSFQSYTVSVTARNIYGRSKPSQIIISSQSQDSLKSIPLRINGTGDGFSLSWDAVVTANCGYIVEWCPVSGDCSMEWLKVPPNNTSATIYSQNFKDGVRYLLSAYSCTDDTPVLLEQREGYVKELRIADNMFKHLKWQQHSSDVEISWDPIVLKDQSAFIHGYVLYCIHESTVVTVTTDDPLTTRLTAKKLNITTYNFALVARTSQGECGLTTLSVTLTIQTDNVVSAIIIVLITAFSLFLLMAVVCFRHWACIKQKVYPSIPEPVLIGKWLPSQDVLSYCPKEELTMVLPKLHDVLTTSTDGYICQKLNSSTKTSESPTFTSASLNVIPNPLYDLLMQENVAQFACEAEYQDQDGKAENANNYRSQLLEDLFFNRTNCDSGMSCSSTYIVLPHSSVNPRV